MLCLGYACIRTNAEKSQPFSGALSICDDYCDHLLNTWCLSWVNEPDIPSWISPVVAQAMISECTVMYGKTWEWPSIATDLAWLKSFHQKWGRIAGCRLIALACDESDLVRMVEATRPPPQQPGYAAMGALGHYVMAQREVTIDPTWPVLGWEVLEANSAVLADCHTDIDRADPVTGLLSDLAAARTLVEKLQQDPHIRSYAFIPLAIVAIPDENVS